MVVVLVDVAVGVVGWCCWLSVFLLLVFWLLVSCCLLVLLMLVVGLGSLVSWSLLLASGLWLLVFGLLSVVDTMLPGSA
jgi:hypothetical protein